jgi:hypothetical protein
VVNMTECAKSLKQLVSLSAKSFKWSVLIGRAGDDSALSVTQCLSGFTHFVTALRAELSCPHLYWVPVPHGQSLHTVHAVTTQSTFACSARLRAGSRPPMLLKVVYASSVATRHDSARGGSSLGPLAPVTRGLHSYTLELNLSNSRTHP